MFKFPFLVRDNSAKKQEGLKKGWVRRPSNDRGPIFVFVHGFLSGADGCWRNGKGATWPEMLRDDCRFEGVGIYVSQYHTQIDSGDYDIVQCANEIFRDLTFQSDDGFIPLSCKQVVFVCHSLGGILIRRILELNKSKFIDHKIGLILLGSPSKGSDYANMLEYVSAAFGNKIGGQLKKNSDILDDLDARFRRLIHQKELPGLVGLELVEHHGMLRCKWLPFLRLKPVVTEDSASRYFGEVLLVPETNHSTLVKPESLDSPVYEYLLRFYVEEFRRSLVDIKSNQESSNVLGADSLAEIERTQRANVLFDIYSDKVAEYYLTRNLDEQVIRDIEFWSLWLCGESGVGKTSIAKRLIGVLGDSPIYVDMGGLSGFSLIDFRKNLIDTVSNVCDVSLSCDASVLELAAAIAASGKYNSGVLIFVDEVPVPSDKSLGWEAVEFIQSLVLSLRVKFGNLTRVVICSINEPNDSFLSGKGREQIKIIKMDAWSYEEMLKLSNWLVKLLNINPHSASEVHDLVWAAGGSPRILKAFYKNYISSSNSICDSKFSDVLKLAITSRVGNENG